MFSGHFLHVFFQYLLSQKTLAKKMTVLYKLAREQLSKQHHYDFGLRALKSVLVMAGELKRGSSELREVGAMCTKLSGFLFGSRVSNECWDGSAREHRSIKKKLSFFKYSFICLSLSFFFFFKL